MKLFILIQQISILNTTYYYDPHPFVPSNRDLRAKRCKEVFDIQQEV